MLRLSATIATALLLFGVRTAAAPSPLRLPPRDECSSVPAFAAFRTDLESVVRRRDVSALQKLSASEIMYTSDGEKGWRAFADDWKLGQKGESDLWLQLAMVLRLGCARDGSNMIMPYYSARLPEGKDEEVIYLPVRDGVPVLSKPNIRSRVVTLTHWDVLYAHEYAADGVRWIKVATGDGKRGS